MIQRIGRFTAIMLLICLATGCATRFSPASIRQEIVLQQGTDPLSAFEFSLGRFTTLLLQTALAGEDGEIPFAGLEQLQLAVYEAPNESGPALDVTRIRVNGWEPVIRAHDTTRSALVLVQSGRRWGSTPNVAPTVADLVVVGAGPRKVVYARLRGTLSADLPAALAGVLRDGGPEEIRRVLMQFSE